MSRIARIVAALTVAAAVLTPTVSAADPPPDQQVCYSEVPQTSWTRPRSHDEHRYQRDTLVDEHRYEKFVKGTKEQRKSGRWKDAGQFGWMDWPGAGPLDWGQIPDPISGPHRSVWVDGDFRYTSTRYEYRIVDTRQVPGTPDTTGWLAAPPAGDGWTIIETRTVDDPPETVGPIDGTEPPAGDGWTQVGDVTWRQGDEVPCPIPPVNCDTSIVEGSVAAWLDLNDFDPADCFDYQVSEACSTVTVDVTTQPSPGYESPYRAVWVEGDTFDLDAAQPFPATFTEDHNGGSTTITWTLVGPESDWLRGTDHPNVWDQTSRTVEVDTDCEDTPPPPPPPPVEITPAPPVLTEACGAVPFVTLPPVTGAAWRMVNGPTGVGPTVPLLHNSTVEFELVALDGYTGGEVYTVTTAPAVDCPTTTTAAPPPPPVAPPTSPAPTLPVTGSSTGLLAGAGLLLALAGAGLVVAARRVV